MNIPPYTEYVNYYSHLHGNTLTHAFHRITLTYLNLYQISCSFYLELRFSPDISYRFYCVGAIVHVYCVNWRTQGGIATDGRLDISECLRRPHCARLVATRACAALLIIGMNIRLYGTNTISRYISTSKHRRKSVLAPHTNKKTVSFYEIPLDHILDNFTYTRSKS